MVVVVGLMFNWQLEKDKKEIQQLQIAQTMLSTLFSEDKFKTLATKRLMDEVLESEKLKNEIGSIVEDYLTVKFNKSFEEGDYDSEISLIASLYATRGLPTRTSTPISRVSLCCSISRCNSPIPLIIV